MDLRKTNHKIDPAYYLNVKKRWQTYVKTNLFNENALDFIDNLHDVQILTSDEKDSASDSILVSATVPLTQAQEYEIDEHAIYTGGVTNVNPNTAKPWFTSQIMLKISRQHDLIDAIAMEDNIAMYETKKVANLLAGGHHNQDIKRASNAVLDEMLDNHLLVEGQIYQHVAAIQDNHSPHIVPFLGNLHVDADEDFVDGRHANNVIREVCAQRRWTKVSVLILEKITGPNMSTFITTLDRQNVASADLLWDLAFQLFYTLETFNRYGLAHSDLHLGNVFIEELPAPVTLEYVLPATTLTGPHSVTIRTRFMTRIFDFDRSAVYFPKVERNMTLDLEFCELAGECNQRSAQFDTHGLAMQLLRAAREFVPYKHNLLVGMIQSLVSVKVIAKSLEQEYTQLSFHEVRSTTATATNKQPHPLLSAADHLPSTLEYLRQWYVDSARFSNRIKSPNEAYKTYMLPTNIDIVFDEPVYRLKEMPDPNNNANNNNSDDRSFPVDEAVFYVHAPRLIERIVNFQRDFQNDKAYRALYPYTNLFNVWINELAAMPAYNIITTALHLLLEFSQGPARTNSQNKHFSFGFGLPVIFVCIFLAFPMTHGLNEAQKWLFLHRIFPALHVLYPSAFTDVKHLQLYMTSIANTFRGRLPVTMPILHAQRL